MADLYARIHYGNDVFLIPHGEVTGQFISKMLKALREGGDHALVGIEHRNGAATLLISPGVPLWIEADPQIRVNDIFDSADEVLSGGDQ
jgi:hypothetical protein